MVFCFGIVLTAWLDSGFEILDTALSVWQQTGRGDNVVATFALSRFLFPLLLLSFLFWVPIFRRTAMGGGIVSERMESPHGRPVLSCSCCVPLYLAGFIDLVCSPARWRRQLAHVSVSGVFSRSGKRGLPARLVLQGVFRARVAKIRWCFFDCEMVRTRGKDELDSRG